MTRTRLPWSKSIGQRGHRVRLYEPRPSAPIMRSIWINGKENRKSLGHRDRELATRQGYELLSALVANELAFSEESLTLGMLRELYVKSPRHLAKKAGTQKHDESKLKRVVTFLGPSRNVVSLSESDVQRFVTARRAGEKGLEGATAGKAVQNRTIEADLMLLLAALNWGGSRTVRHWSAALAGKPADWGEAAQRAEPQKAGVEPRRIRQGAGGCPIGSSAA